MAAGKNYTLVPGTIENLVIHRAVREYVRNHSRDVDSPNILDLMAYLAAEKLLETLP